MDGQLDGQEKKRKGCVIGLRGQCLSSRTLSGGWQQVEYHSIQGPVPFVVVFSDLQEVTDCTPIKFLGDARVVRPVDTPDVPVKETQACWWNDQQLPHEIQEGKM